MRYRSNPLSLTTITDEYTPRTVRVVRAAAEYGALITMAAIAGYSAGAASKGVHVDNAAAREAIIYTLNGVAGAFAGAIFNGINEGLDREYAGEPWPKRPSMRAMGEGATVGGLVACGVSAVAYGFGQALH